MLPTTLSRRCEKIRHGISLHGIGSIISVQVALLLGVFRIVIRVELGSSYFPAINDGRTGRRRICTGKFQTLVQFGRLEPFATCLERFVHLRLWVVFHVCRRGRIVVGNTVSLGPDGMPPRFFLLLVILLVSINIIIVVVVVVIIIILRVNPHTIIHLPLKMFYTASLQGNVPLPLPLIRLPITITPMRSPIRQKWIHSLQQLRSTTKFHTVFHLVFEILPTTLFKGWISGLPW
mmetsp:Transcript_28272/g.58907  ORF Transcript_28272/g.58907 Transcript_28272/m.58907 type:complete len:234 (+) Transcript_28272:2507-3208(+)